MKVYASLVVLFCSIAAQAQTSVAPAAVDELRHAAHELSYLKGFFLKPGAADEGEISDNYRALGEAAQTFLTLAPSGYIEDAMRGVRQTYALLNIPAPSILQFVVVDAERRRDPRLTQRLASTLADVADTVASTLAADSSFGPIRENPALYDALRSPHSGVDLLRNVRLLLGHDWALRRDFYTAGNMKRMFGIDVVMARNSDGTPSLRNATTAAPDGEIRCEYTIWWRQAVDNKVAGGFRIDCHDVGAGLPTFDEIEHVFGKRWKDGLQVFGPPVDGGPPAARATHGNLGMVFDLGDSAMKRRLVVSFDPDGHMHHLRVEVEQL